MCEGGLEKVATNEQVSLSEDGGLAEGEVGGAAARWLPRLGGSCSPRLSRVRVGDHGGRPSRVGVHVHDAEHKVT